MSRRVIAMISAGALALLAGGAWTYESAIAAPLRDARARRNLLVAEIEKREKEVRDHRATVKELKEIGGTMLGRDAESVVHRLRVALTSLGHEAGLQDVVVDSRAKGAVRNPAAQAGVTAFGEELAERADMSVVAGELKGEGKLDDVLRALALLESQPWPKRVSGVSLKPVPNADRVALSVSLETAFFEDFGPMEPPPRATPAADRIELASLVGLKNVFRAPAPEAKAQAEPPIRPTEAPSAPSLADWKVTGIVEQRSDDTTRKAEVWLSNARSGEFRVLCVGDSFLGAVLDAVAPDQAVFLVDGGRYVLATGDHLDRRDRQPAPQ